MGNTQESLWSSGYHRICGMDEILNIPVNYALLSIVMFFLEQKLSSFSRLVTCSFKSPSAEVAADLEGGGIFRGSSLKGFSYK